jgi:hypothetical protein
MFPTSDDFTALWDFHWVRIASPSPGNWLTVRSWMLMKFSSFDENWSLVIWRFLRWILLKNVAIYHCRWRLGMLDLTQNWFEIVFQAFDFSSQKNRLVMIEWICQFHNLMTWPHLLVEVISWVLVSVLYGGLRTCSVVSPFETSFSKSPCRRGLLGLLLFTPLWQSFA